MYSRQGYVIRQSEIVNRKQNADCEATICILRESKPILNDSCERTILVSLHFLEG